MSRRRSLPPQLRPLIQAFEGLHRVRRDGLIVPYLCPAGYPTQGWGRVVRSMNEPPIDRATADLWLLEDALRHMEMAIDLAPGLGTESDERIAAIADFVFNLGAGRFRSSTLRKRILAGKWGDVPNQLRRWVFGGGQRLPGLVLRREAEIALIEGRQWTR